MEIYVCDYMVVGSPPAVWFSGTSQQRTVIPNRIASEPPFYVDIQDIFKNTKKLLGRNVWSYGVAMKTFDFSGSTVGATPLAVAFRSISDLA